VGSETRAWPRNGKGVFKQQPGRQYSPSTPLQASDFVVAIASQYSNQGMLTAGRAARKVPKRLLWGFCGGNRGLRRVFGTLDEQGLTQNCPH